MRCAGGADKASPQGGGGAVSDSVAGGTESCSLDHRGSGHLCDEDAERNLQAFIQGMRSPSGDGADSWAQFSDVPTGIKAAAPVCERLLPLTQIMDPAPHMVVEEMPAPRLYPLFARAGTNAACVVTRRGEFRGLLSRSNLISAAKDSLRPLGAQGRRYQPLPA
eukprot:gnl/TRDRNA2_/TRDRNA2_135451_c2_seq1.p1 gnl/TRDRNA2_/TRDRNA2_135451_c2~~gnl/TRDRNA2_/TRDRNA2_135451_c2_seq1.p1  ORF type:complete len:164 (+),score=25.61 gnl/TRDRNA2_/TRDRNA2_135451_c2_seq1:154-645(+)